MGFDSKFIFSREVIDEQMEETLRWMQENKQSYGPDGTLDQMNPWWTVPSRPTTELEKIVLSETRNRVLRDRAYEHGILHALHGLSEKGEIAPLDKKTIDVIVNDAMTPGVINQLLARKVREKTLDGVKLCELSKLYGHGKDTKPARIRDRVVKPLHPVGILSVRFAGEYDISIGPVAEAFMLNVYLKVVNDTDINI